MVDPDFVCALCDTDVFCLPAAPDAIPICMMCRGFCGMERRWFGGNEVRPLWDHRPRRSRDPSMGFFMEQRERS